MYARAHGVSLAGVSLADFAPAGPAAPLVRLQVVRLSDGQVLTLTGEYDWERVRVQAGEKRLSVYLDRPLGIDLSVSVEARAAEGDAIEWRTSVLNQSDAYSVLSASYPAVRFCDAQDTSFFKPLGSGAVDADAVQRRKRWNGDYPSGFHGTMPVLGVYDPAQKRGSGLYAAVHAPQAEKLFLSAAFFENGEGCFDFDYPAQNMGRPANSFALNGALVLRVLDGDWYDMARIYGDDVHACAEWCPPLGREDSPAWMRDVPMYIMDWMPNDNPAADPVPISVRPAAEPPRDNWYKKPIELADRLGLPIGYHLYNWHFIPFNNDYPYYFPVKEGLETGVREMHRHGIHVMPYINGRIVDTRDMHGSTERFDREFRAGATKSPDGSLNLERYASHEPDGTLCELAAMCPSEKVWRDTLAEIARRLFEDYDMDAVYIDQVAAARINLCCDPAHGHTPGNGAWWVRSYRLLMERLRRECPEGHHREQRGVLRRSVRRLSDLGLDGSEPGALLPEGLRGPDRHAGPQHQRLQEGRRPVLPLPHRPGGDVRPADRLDQRRRGGRAGKDGLSGTHVPDALGYPGVLQPRRDAAAPGDHPRQRQLPV